MSIAKSSKRIRQLWRTWGFEKQEKPSLVTDEGALRVRGKNAQISNIRAARVIAEVIKSSLGPSGMDKLLIDYYGQTTISNNGAAILNKINDTFASIVHPAARLVMEVARTQEEIVGDGTTTAIILTAELLRRAEEMLDQNIHPIFITKGYRMALKKALETLTENAITIDFEDDEALRKIAITSMNGHITGTTLEHLSSIVVEAAKQIVEHRGNRRIVDKHNIQIVKRGGKSLMETRLIQGVVLEKEIASILMPSRIDEANIALLSCPVDMARLDIGVPEINIRNPSQRKSFLDEENRIIKEIVHGIKASGANVVFCKLNIEKRAQFLMAREGILAVSRVEESDMERLAKATGAIITHNVKDLRTELLGYAKLVEERENGIGKKAVFVEGCRAPHSVAVLIRGGLGKNMDEAERIVRNAISVISNIALDNRVIAGGGASDMQVAKALRRHALTVGGREQLAIQAFAKSMETIPKILAENAGQNPVDVVLELRNAQERDDGKYFGFSALDGNIVDMWKEGIIEPLRVKDKALRLAFATATSILKVDDVIFSANISVGPPLPKGPAKK